MGDESVRYISRNAEEGLKQKMIKLAFKACAEEQVRFVECTKQGKWHAVTQCREELRTLNTCLAPQYVPS